MPLTIISARDFPKELIPSNPNARISLSDMLSHPFITKYFPNAAQSLIKPDNTSKHKPFVVSKDDPKTWDPYQKENQKDDNNQKEIKIGKQRSREASPKGRSKSPNRVPTDSRSPRKEKIVI